MLRTDSSVTVLAKNYRNSLDEIAEKQNRIQQLQKEVEEAIKVLDRRLTKLTLPEAKKQLKALQPDGVFWEQDGTWRYKPFPTKMWGGAPEMETIAFNEKACVVAALKKAIKLLK